MISVCIILSSIAMANRGNVDGTDIQTATTLASIFIRRRMQRHLERIERLLVIGATLFHAYCRS